MTITASSNVGPSAYWYLTRSSGIVALLLLTAAIVLGVLDVSRASTRRYPRFVIDGAHRTVSLLSVAFLAIHIITAVLDTFAPIRLIDAFIPFGGSYRPLWLGFGALALDLSVAVAITSLIRTRLGYVAWRWIHWLSYASWPVAVLHGLGTGSDTKQGWLLALNVACVLVVIGAVAARVTQSWAEAPRVAAAGMSSALVFAAGLLVWLPGGPLGKGWARRAGTPASLLSHPVGTGAKR